MPEKIIQLPRREKRLCPWCENAFTLPDDYSNQMCPECRNKLLELPKEALVDLLGKVTGLNVIIMSALPVPPDILHRLDLRAKGSGRRLTMSEAVAITKQRPQ